MTTSKQSFIKNKNNSLVTGINKPIYSFYDKGLGHTEIFTQPNDAIAVRLFTELVNKEGHPMNKYAESMELWYLGSYNDKTGAITDGETRKVTEGLRCLMPKNSEEK